MVAEVIGRAGRCIDSQILLRRLEVLQEAVIEAIDFVVVEVKPVVEGPVSNVPNFDCTEPGYLPLNTQRIGLGIGLLDVWVDRRPAHTLEEQTGLVDRLRVNRRRLIERRDHSGRFSRYIDAALNSTGTRLQRIGHSGDIARRRHSMYRSRSEELRAHAIAGVNSPIIEEVV